MIRPAVIPESQKLVRIPPFDGPYEAGCVITSSRGAVALPKNRPTESQSELILARASEGRERVKAKGVKRGRKPELIALRKCEAIKRRDYGRDA